MTEQGGKKRIGSWTTVALVATSVAFDLLQFFFTLFHAFIPPIGTVIAFFIPLFLTMFALTIFHLWFAFLGVHYLGEKGGTGRLLAGFGVAMGELLPLFQAIPWLTAFIITTIITTRMKDAASAKETRKKKEAAERTQETHPA